MTTNVPIECKILKENDRLAAEDVTKATTIAQRASRKFSSLPTIRLL